MIAPGSLTQDDVGRWVTYKPHHAPDDPTQWETGRIKSWNDSGVFVVYKANGMLHGREEWKDYTAQHTNYDDLTFIKENV